MRPHRPLHGRIPKGSLLRVARPDANEWAKLRQKTHLLAR